MIDMKKVSQDLLEQALTTGTLRLMNNSVFDLTTSEILSVAKFVSTKDLVKSDIQSGAVQNLPKEMIYIIDEVDGTLAK